MLFTELTLVTLLLSMPPPGPVMRSVAPTKRFFMRSVSSSGVLKSTLSTQMHDSYGALSTTWTRSHASLWRHQCLSFTSSLMQRLRTYVLRLLMHCRRHFLLLQQDASCSVVNLCLPVTSLQLCVHCRTNSHLTVQCQHISWRTALTWLCHTLLSC